MTMLRIFTKRPHATNERTSVKPFVKDFTISESRTLNASSVFDKENLNPEYQAAFLPEGINLTHSQQICYAHDLETRRSMSSSCRKGAKSGSLKAELRISSRDAMRAALRNQWRESCSMPN